MDTEKNQETPDVIRTALESLAEFAQDEGHMRRYRERLMVLRDERSMIEEAREQGRKQGESIGRIHGFQTLLKQPLTPHAALNSMTLDELRVWATDLEEQITRAMGRDKPH